MAEIEKRKIMKWTPETIQKLFTLVETAEDKQSGYKKAADHFNITTNACCIKYRRMLNLKIYEKSGNYTGIKQSVVKTAIDRKNKVWTRKDCIELKKIVKSAPLKADGLRLASERFGVSEKSVTSKFNRVNKTGVNKNRKFSKRKYTKAKYSPVIDKLAKILTEESNKIVFSIGMLTAHVPKISEISIDFDKRSITYTY